MEIRGLKPRTSSLPAKRSNQLSYIPLMLLILQYLAIEYYRQHYFIAQHSCFWYGNRTLGYNRGMLKKESSKTSSKSQQNDELPLIISNKPLAITLLACIIFATSGMMWWKYVYNSPQRVFTEMLSNNLSTQSVTRVSESDNNGNKIEKYEQLSFVPNIASRVISTVEEKSETGNTKIKTETIGTIQYDFSRYLQIDTDKKNKEGKKLDYSSVQNIWAKSGNYGQQPPQYLTQSMLGIVPFGNLDQKTKQKALELIIDKKSYDVQYDKVKPKRIDKRSALEFPVKVNLAEYVAVLKLVAKASGLGDLKEFRAEDYKNQPPAEMVMIVDKHSRQLMEVIFAGSPGQKERYRSYGLSLLVQIPDNAIPISDLEQKVQNIK